MDKIISVEDITPFKKAIELHERLNINLSFDLFNSFIDFYSDWGNYNQIKYWSEVRRIYTNLIIKNKTT